MSDAIRVEQAGGVARVTLATGPGNPLTLEALQELRRVVIHLGDQPPDLVVLRADGDDFSVGLPTHRSAPVYGAFEPLVAQRDAFRAQEVILRLRGAIDGWGRLPCPVVASVRGRCLGAGLALALAADFRVCADDAELGVPDVDHGIISGLGTLSRLAVMLGTARTMTAVLTQERWTGAEAQRMGLAARSCPAADVEAATEVLVGELLHLPAQARQQGLITLRTLQDSLLRTTLEAETQASARTWIAGDWLQHLA